MNHYLADFLTVDIMEHLSIIIHALFLPNGSLVFHYFRLVFEVLCYIALPFVIVRVLSGFEKKHPKWVVVIDILSVVIFALIGIQHFVLHSHMRTAISSRGTFYGTPFSGLVMYRNNIGRFCGILYSLLINNRLLSKYFQKLKIEKYQKVIFIALFLVFLFILYYFYYLCRFL